MTRIEYRNRVAGCWLGKSIGGTLGAPFEWRRQVNDVSFYTQELGGEPLPNDDLDLQLLWLVALEEQGIELDAHTLAEYWLLYITPHWCEYGNAKNNLRLGILPPWSGIVSNPYRHSCGAFIRSEIWACIAPGLPELAARFAYQDACVDHGDGEGMYAEVFCAAVESAAFFEQDMSKLWDVGLSYIPAECGVAGAIRLARECHAEGRSWREARDLLLEKYRGRTALGQLWCTCPEEQERGFHEGVLGWDAPSNIGIVTLAMFYGEGDFDKTVCTAVNCGEDTDCTAATVGALWGILHGADAIPERWILPIGTKIKTACLNMGELGYFGNQLPSTVGDLSARTERVVVQVLARYAEVESQGDSIPDFNPGGFALSDTKRDELYSQARSCVFRSGFCEVSIGYGEGLTLNADRQKEIQVRIGNTGKIAATYQLRWYLPTGWRVSPGPDHLVHVKPEPWNHSRTLAYTLVAETQPNPVNRMVLEVTIPGRSLVMLVPVHILGDGSGLTADEEHACR